MTEKILTCICGAEFNDSQKFNSHKSHCKIHYLHKYGGLAEYEQHTAAKHKAIGDVLHKKAEAKKQAEFDSWVAEQHKCERCGKLMTEKFGTGRFCSRACANARDHSTETKEKIRKALVRNEQPKITPKVKITKHKDTCLICGKLLTAGHKSQYCAKHLIEQRQETRLNDWLITGNIGLNPDCTIRGVFREYILKEQHSCCAICGMPNEWNGKPLVFVLDHINGDASYSARENLRLICPNCDSQLNTFKAKNKNSARTKRKKYLQEIRDLDK